MVDKEELDPRKYIISTKKNIKEKSANSIWNPKFSTKRHFIPKTLSQNKFWYLLSF